MRARPSAVQLQGADQLADGVVAVAHEPPLDARVDLLRERDEAGIDELDAVAFDAFADLTLIADQPVAQSFELRPVGVESDAEEADLRARPADEGGRRERLARVAAKSPSPASAPAR